MSAIEALGLTPAVQAALISVHDELRDAYLGKISALTKENEALRRRVAELTPLAIFAALRTAEVDVCKKCGNVYMRGSVCPMCGSGK